MNSIKVLIGEIDGVEKEYSEEYDLDAAIEYIHKRNHSHYSISSIERVTIRSGQQMFLKDTGIIVDGELNVEGNLNL